MYAIRWVNRSGEHVLIGSREAVVAAANLCENARIKFKVADVRGALLEPSDLGAGEFTHWLGKTEKFPVDV
jgi:hypothetical protein